MLLLPQMTYRLLVLMAGDYSPIGAATQSTKVGAWHFRRPGDQGLELVGGADSAELPIVGSVMLVT